MLILFPSCVWGTTRRRYPRRVYIQIQSMHTALVSLARSCRLLVYGYIPYIARFLRRRLPTQQPGLTYATQSIRRLFPIYPVSFCHIEDDFFPFK